MVLVSLKHSTEYIFFCFTLFLIAGASIDSFVVFTTSLDYFYRTSCCVSIEFVLLSLLVNKIVLLIRKGRKRTRWKLVFGLLLETGYKTNSCNLDSSYNLD